jgi:hypothetical protein
MSDFTTALERELERLETELKNDPRHRRADQIRALLAEYKNGTPLTLTVSSVPVRRERVRLSKAASVRIAVQEFLRDNGPSHRTLILKHLVETKVMGHEKKPLAALAAYLSEFRELFEPDGRGNFSLKKPAESGAAAPQVSH